MHALVELSDLLGVFFDTLIQNNVDYLALRVHLQEGVGVGDFLRKRLLRKDDIFIAELSLTPHLRLFHEECLRLLHELLLKLIVVDIQAPGAAPLELITLREEDRDWLFVVNDDEVIDGLLDQLDVDLFVFAVPANLVQNGGAEGNEVILEDPIAEHLQSRVSYGLLTLTLQVVLVEVTEYVDETTRINRVVLPLADILTQELALVFSQLIQ